MYIILTINIDGLLCAYHWALHCMASRAGTLVVLYVFFVLLCLDMISNLQKSCKNSTRNLFMPFTQIRLFYSFFSIYLAVSLHVYIDKHFFPEPFEKKLEICPFISLCFGMCFLRIRPFSYKWQHSDQN